MRRIFWLSLALFLLSQSLVATPPCTLNYQGRIRLNSTGLAVPDSSGNTVTFNLYTTAAGGSSIWSETWNGSITTNSGLFSVILGSISPTCNLAFDVPYYLEIVWTNSSNSPETLSPRQPLSMSPYAKNVVGPLSLTNSTSAASTIYAAQTNGGIGVYGVGMTGVAGVANSSNSIGVLASDGGQSTALALKVNGGALFSSPGFVSFSSYVDFSGAIVTGLNVGVSVPLTLSATLPYPSALITASNTGTGNAIVGYITQPGSIPGGGTPDLNSNLTSGIKGYTNVSASAGVAGYSNITMSAGVGVLGIGYIGIGGFGTASYVSSVGGTFGSQSLGGTGVNGQAPNGIGGTFQGLTGLVANGNGFGAAIVASQNNGGLAIQTSGPSQLNGWLSVNGTTYLNNDVSFSAGSTVNFNNANIIGFSGGGGSVSPPLSLSGNFSAPIISIGNSGGDGIDINGTEGTGLFVSGGTNDAIYVSGNNDFNAIDSYNYSGGDAIYALVGGGGGFNPYAVEGLDQTGDPEAAGVYGESYNGWGVYGQGDNFNGIGVEAVNNNAGGLALLVTGDSQFSSNSNVDLSDTNVDFTGATVTGLNATITPPLNLSASLAAPTPLISAYNFGSGDGMDVYSQGGFSLNATGNNGNAIYASANSSFDTVLVTNDEGGDAIYSEVGGSSGFSPYAIYGQDTTGDLESVGVFGESTNGWGVYGQGDNSDGIGVAAVNHSSGGLALQVIGDSEFSTGSNVDLSATNVDFTGANITGLNLLPPLNLSGSFTAPIITVNNYATGPNTDGIDIDTAGSIGLYVNGGGNNAIYINGNNGYDSLVSDNNSGGDAISAVVDGSTTAYAVFGEDASGATDSVGVYGETGQGWGVYGISNLNGIGVEAVNNNPGSLALKVTGDSEFSTGSNVDLSGTNVDFTGANVTGLNLAAPLSLTLSTASGAAVYGFNSVGGYGLEGEAAGPGNVAVYGNNVSSGMGILGESAGGIGVMASVTDAAGALWGYNGSASGFGIVAQNNAGPGTAGAALYVVGASAMSFQSVTVNSATLANATLNAFAGRVYFTFNGQPSSGTFILSDSAITPNTVVHLTMIGFPPTIAGPTVTVPATGGSIELFFPTAPNWIANPMNGFIFDTVRLQ